MFNWNLLGILFWVLIILYLIFIIQNIRRRRIKMIISQHKNFTWANFSIDIIEIAIFLVASIWMFNVCFMDNPNLEDSSRIQSSVKYEPLIMNTGEGNSTYVSINSAKKKVGSQTYTFYSSGSKMTVSSTYASVSSGRKPIDVNAEKIPYNKKVLKQMDRKYQNAYVAIYTAYYKNNPANGIGLHADHLATRYYLIRIPDTSFIKEK